MIAFIRNLFRRRTPQEKFADGERCAQDFLDGNPSDDEIRQYWSSAHVDRDLSGDPYFAEGTIAAMRPTMERLKE